MDILTIKNLKELPVVDRQDVGEVLAFDDGGNLVKVESVEYTIEPLYETFNDFTGDGRWWANAAEYGFDGFSFVEINASEYGNNKYTDGYNVGTTDGYNVGREEGYTDGYNVGREDGYSNGYNVGREDGYSNGYNIGRQETVDNASELYVTNNGVYEGDLYKRVEVNIVPKISIRETEIRCGRSTFKKTPDNFIVDGSDSIDGMFRECINLTDISSLSEWDVSSVSNFNGVFASDEYLNDVSALSNWDMSNATDLSEFFFSVFNVVDYSPIENWDTSKVTDFYRLFYYTQGAYNKVEKIPALRADNVTNMGQIFSNTSPTSTLTTFGGFQNLKCNWNDGKGLDKTPNLTYESCINVLNGLYDFTSNGETPSSSEGKLKVHQNFLDLVGDEINIGISKGWTITA